MELIINISNWLATHLAINILTLMVPFIKYISKDTIYFFEDFANL